MPKEAGSGFVAFWHPVNCGLSFFVLGCALRGRDCLFCEPQNSLRHSVKQLQLPFTGVGCVWSQQWAVSPHSRRGQRGDCTAGPRAGSL